MTLSARPEDTAPPLPRWDVTDLYPSVTSREYAAAQEQIAADVARLRGLYDQHDVRGGDKTADDETVAAFDAVLDATNDLLDRLRTVSGYASAFTTTDVRDDAAQAEQARLQMQMAELAKLRGRFDAWVAAIGAEALVSRSPAASDHAYPLTKAEVRARHLMTEAEEDLAADLAVTGSQAWSRL